jgi:hypothetical protein
MDAPINIGLIHGGKGQIPEFSGKPVANAVVRKIFISEANDSSFLKDEYPGAEIVYEKEAIIQDKDIDLVIVYESGSDDLDVIGKALKTGKQVQVLR